MSLKTDILAALADEPRVKDVDVNDNTHLNGEDAVVINVFLELNKQITCTYLKRIKLNKKQMLELTVDKVRQGLNGVFV